MHVNQRVVGPYRWQRSGKSIEEVVEEVAADNPVGKVADEIEARGEGCVQLGERKYLEITVLYSFIRNSEYKADAHIEEHYPYKDMIPSMYRGYVREDWSPGEYFNYPEQTIVFTSRNKLMDFLESGGKLPAKERKKLLMGRPTRGRTERLQWAATPELKSWIEDQAQDKESLSDVIHRLLENMKEISE